MLGPKIRDIRKIKDLTLKEVSDKTQLTASYLSQIERDLIEPSLSSLRKIAQALNVPIYEFLSDDSVEHVLIKANERKKLDLPNSSITYEFITPMSGQINKSPRMELIYYKLNPNGWSSDEFIHHAADECIFVMKGKMHVFLNENKYVLEEGDSIYIHENIPHKLYNPGDEIAVGISSISPPIY